MGLAEAMVTPVVVVVVVDCWEQGDPIPILMVPLVLVVVVATSRVVVGGKGVLVTQAEASAVEVKRVNTAEEEVVATAAGVVVKLDSLKAQLVNMKTLGTAVVVAAPSLAHPHRMPSRRSTATATVR